MNIRQRRARAPWIAGPRHGHTAFPSLNRVPEITVPFRFVKIMAATAGEPCPGVHDDIVVQCATIGTA